MKVSSSCLGRNSSGNSGNSGNSVPNSLQIQRDRLASSRCGEPGHPLSDVVPLTLPPANPTPCKHETNPCHGECGSCALMGPYSRVPM
ncbi:hypothetical protein QLX08_004616 [Tetragonisca angustula]|uniref:Uncharacterized protein n=1 Tax=Tetragonisca angustula TaxID=166442 RepID=A0AAW1A245_9HYME